MQHVTNFLRDLYSVLHLSPLEVATPITSQLCDIIAGLGSRSRVFLTPWSRSRLREKNQEPEPLGKKSGAGASKNLAGSSALLEDKKHKDIIRLLLSLGKIVSCYS